MKNLEKWDFFQIQRYRLDELNIYELWVYSVLCSYANNETLLCYPSITTISKSLKVSPNTVRKYIDCLVWKWFIDLETRFNNNKQSSHIYRIIKKDPCTEWSTPFNRWTPTPSPDEDRTIRSLNKRNYLKEKNNTAFEKKADTLSSFWLNKANIEKWFEFKKPLDRIINDCNWITRISRELNIKPVYNKDTINATDILRNKHFLDDEKWFMDYIKNDWIVCDVKTYQDLIRQDYYLPVEIDN